MTFNSHIAWYLVGVKRDSGHILKTGLDPTIHVNAHTRIKPNSFFFFFIYYYKVVPWQFPPSGIHFFVFLLSENLLHLLVAFFSNSSIPKT